MGFKKINLFFQKKLYGYNIPKIIKAKPFAISPDDKICILAPHADDESIGCGGLLAKYAKQCDVILLTDGSRAGDVKVREKEFESVMSFFGVKNYQLLKAKDGDLLSAYNKFKQIDFSDYDYVLMPHPLDAHKDHVVPQAFFERLQKENKKIKAKTVYYEVWSPISLPSHYIDITDVIEVKKKAINMYVSQVAGIDYASRILGLNHYHGIRHNVLYEECFIIK